MEQRTKVAINGFGRIGRLTFRRLFADPSVEVVAINDLTDIETLAHLLQWDSVHGKYSNEVKATSDGIAVNDTVIRVYQNPNPADLPWSELGIDVVIESTGRFVTKEGASLHLEAGAERVIISAPAKGDVKTIVLGVNEETLEDEDRIISNASCTTNCLAPVIKVLDDAFGVEQGYITTVHAYTADQNIQDAPHKDLRRARGAAQSIIPTTTGAASAVGKVLPHLKGRLDGIAMRVPVPDGSITDVTVILSEETTEGAVNGAFQAAANDQLKGILEYTTVPIVSADIVGNPHSSIVDGQLTSVNGRLVKLVAWYDNEYAYACRTAELVEYACRPKAYA